MQNVTKKERGPRVYVGGWKVEVEAGDSSERERANRNVLHICECSPAQDETEYGSGVTDWRRRKSCASCEARFLTHVLTAKGVLMRHS